MPNWNLGLAGDVGMNALGAFEKGQQARQQDNARNAMTAYVANPGEQTLNGLAAYQPEFVMQQRQQMAQQQEAEREKQLVGAALNGDPAARQQLAYVNSDLYMKLGEGQRKQVDALMGHVAQTAFSILQLPADQQGPALDQALAGLKAQGFDTDTFVRTGNAQQDLRVALAIAGQLDDFEKFAAPKYEAVGEGGLVGFQFGKPIQQGGQTQDFSPGQADMPPPPPGFVMNGGQPAGTTPFAEAFGRGL